MKINSIDHTNTFVLLIGSSAFPQDKTISSIPNVVANLKKLREILANSELIGIPEANIITSLNENKGQVERRLRDIVDKTRSKNQTLLVYYTGHGILSSEDYQLYLTTYYTSKRDLEIEGINIDNFKKYIKKSIAGRKIVILDCCHSGAIIGAMDGGMPSKIQSGLNGFEGTYVMTSAAEDTPSLYPIDNPKEPTYFTGKIIEILNEGLDNDKEFCTLRDIYNTIELEFIQKKLPKPQQSNFNNADQLYFAINRKYTEKKSEDELAWEQTHFENTLEKYTEFKKEFPQSPFVKQAIAKINLIEETTKVESLKEQKNGEQKERKTNFNKFLKWIQRFRIQFTSFLVLAILVIFGLIWLNNRNSNQKQSELSTSTLKDTKVYAVMDSLTKKWGFQGNNSKKLLVPYRYESVDTSIEGITRIYDNKKFGFVDSMGGIKIIAKYDFASRFHEGLSAVKLNGKMGFIDKTGKEVIPLEYDLVDNFFDDLARVELYNSTGFIDKSGKVVIGFYEYFDATNFHNGVSLAINKNGWNYIDKRGRVIYTFKPLGPLAPNSDNLKLSGDRIMIVSFGRNSERFFEHYGFADKEGKVIIPIKYDEAGMFSNGLAPVKFNNKWGFIDKDGKLIIPFLYDAAESFSEGKACVKLNGKYGYIDINHDIVIPFNYYDAKSFSSGLAVARISADSSYGFIDKIGNMVIPAKYGSAYNFMDGYATVSFDGAYGVIDKGGQMVVPFRYGARPFFHEGLFEVKIGSRKIYIDKTGKELN